MLLAACREDTKKMLEEFCTEAFRHFAGFVGMLGFYNGSFNCRYMGSGAIDSGTSSH